MENNGIITLSNAMAECKISLFGGHILSYKPKNQEHDIFWMGELNKFDNVQAIRGGVPVCWPRFAQEDLNNHFPRHGFARLSNWQLKNINVDETKIMVHLCLTPDEKYNLDVYANLFITITNKLECKLETINYGNEDFKFSEALHAYFYVGLRDKTLIKGLKNHQYKNALDGKVCTLDEDLVIVNEFDGAFINHTNNVEIIDMELNRVIKLEKKGSNCTVVWNPNKDLKEMSVGQYKNFVCVEPANQGDAYITLEPKNKHEIYMSVKVEKLK